jgi:elongation factor G
MKSYPADKIRNIAVVGHSGSGKTTFLEAALYSIGAIDRMGRVEDGNTVSDFDPDETKKGISVLLSIVPVEVEGVKINFLDTPGYLEFVGEVIAGLAAADAALFVVPANAGVEVGFQNLWEMAEAMGIPRLILVNKMDRENADFGRVLRELNDEYGQTIVPIQLPIGAEASFSGLVDVLNGKARIGKGADAADGDVPADLVDQAAVCREKLIEYAVESEDALMEKYFDSGEISDEESRRGLAGAVAGCRVVPVMVSSSTAPLGVPDVLGILSGLAPSPSRARPSVKGTAPGNGQELSRECSEEAALSLQVFKTTADPYKGRLTFFRVHTGVLRADSQAWNATRGGDERIGQVFYYCGKKEQATPHVGPGDIAAVVKLDHTVTGDTLCAKEAPIVYPPIRFPSPIYSAAIRPKTKADEDRVGAGIQRLLEEDPTFTHHRDTETGQSIVSGMGETHINIIVERLRRKFQADVDIEEPKIPYHETITKPSRAQGKHKKQTGGRGQYGDCWLAVEPTERGAGYEFVNAIVGGAIPKQFIPEVEKGVVKAMQAGAVAGYPVVDIRVTCDDGSYHDVDSSAIAFQTAGSLAFRNAMEGASPVLLEPVVEVEVTTPDEFMGDLMSDFNGKRGQVLGMEPAGRGKQRVRAHVPAAEMQKYAIDLKSITRGRGTFQTKPSHYDVVPAHIAQQVIEAAKRAKEES